MDKRQRQNNNKNTNHMNNLTTHEIQVLEKMKLFPRLDKGAQNRLRKQVDDLRKSSPLFSEAFDKSLDTINVPQQKVRQLTQDKNVFDAIKDAILHPIESVKEAIGKKGLEIRNKAPEILTVPNDVLSKVAEPIDIEEMLKDNTEVTKIVRQMGAALRATGYGARLGLAAPQIGISKRIFVCKGAVCINPEMVVPTTHSMKELIEGCYSVPGKTYKTKRYKTVMAKWWSIDGQLRQYKLRGLDAIVYQHEMQHLDGICCCDIGEEVTK